MGSIVETLGKVSKYISTRLNIVGAGLLFTVALLVTADVTGRAIAKPVPGAFEIVQYMMVMLVMFGVAYTMVAQGHIRVDVFTSRLRPRTQVILTALACFLGLVLFIIGIYAGITCAVRAWHIGAYSEVLRIPQFPFRFMIPLGFFLLFVEVLVQFFRNFGWARGQTGEDKCKVATRR